jgi:hypothetical protein
MADYFGLIQQGCFFGLIIVLATATTSAVAYPLLKTTLLKFNAQTQAILVSWFCFLPLGVTAIVLLSALLPSILQLWGLSSDHCLGHVEGHLHFCLVHLPPLLASWSLSLLAATFIALMGSMVAEVRLKSLILLFHWHFRVASHGRKFICRQACWRKCHCRKD